MYKQSNTGETKSPEIQSGIFDTYLSSVRDTTRPMEAVLVIEPLRSFRLL